MFLFNGIFKDFQGVTLLLKNNFKTQPTFIKIFFKLKK